MHAQRTMLNYGSIYMYFRQLLYQHAGKLHERFFDKDEKVRLGVVKVVCDAADENFTSVPKLVS